MQNISALSRDPNEIGFNLFKYDTRFKYHIKKRVMRRYSLKLSDQLDSLVSIIHWQNK